MSLIEQIQDLVGGVTGYELQGGVDIAQPSLHSAASIAFNPLFWNIVANTEYKTKFLTKSLGRYNGCYILGATIFSLGLFRDYLYTQALENQPVKPSLHHPVLGALLFATGNVLVLSSMFALGVTGTYLGDYFGILMDEPVTGFPFTITNSPMYFGSAMSFLGTALWYGRSAGVWLTGEVLCCYLVALQFEDTFTSRIYAERAEKQKKAT